MGDADLRGADDLAVLLGDQPAHPGVRVGVGEVVEHGLGRGEQVRQDQPPHVGESLRVAAHAGAQVPHDDVHGSARYVRPRPVASEFPARCGTIAA